MTNDEPKISPSAMKAAAQPEYKKLQEELSEECWCDAIDPIEGNGPCVCCVASTVIEFLATNLSRITAALKELVEAVEEYRQKSYTYQTDSITEAEFHVAVHALDAALANAKRALEDK